MGKRGQGTKTGEKPKGKSKFNGKCFNCEVWCHMAHDCPEPEKEEDDNSVSSSKSSNSDKSEETSTAFAEREEEVFPNAISDKSRATVSARSTRAAKRAPFENDHLYQGLQHVQPEQEEWKTVPHRKRRGTAGVMQAATGGKFAFALLQIEKRKGPEHMFTQDFSDSIEDVLFKQGHKCRVQRQ